jgi:hypothetical protein
MSDLIFQETHADFLYYSLYLIPHLDYDYETQAEVTVGGGPVTSYLFCFHFVKFT